MLDIIEMYGSAVLGRASERRIKWRNKKTLEPLGVDFPLNI